MWKVVSEVLPTKRNLFGRKVSTNDLYPNCEQDEKTSHDILWSYAVAQDVWAGFLSSLQKWKRLDAGFYNILENMVVSLQKSELEEIACVLRRIWLQRNRFVFEGKFESPRSILQGAREEKEAF